MASITSQEVIDRLCLQVQALAEAARLAADESAPMDSVYEAVDRCMRSDCGAARMIDVYSAILDSARLVRDSRRTVQKQSEDVAQVYFIRRADGLVKIGYSHDPISRLSQLKQQHQCEMEILATTPGARRAEKTLHEKFSDSRATGEWFRPDDELMDFIAGVRSGSTTTDSLQFH